MTLAYNYICYACMYSFLIGSINSFICNNQIIKDFDDIYGDYGMIVLVSLFLRICCLETKILHI